MGVRASVRLSECQLLTERLSERNCDCASKCNCDSNRLKSVKVKLNVCLLVCVACEVSSGKEKKLEEVFYQSRKRKRTCISEMPSNFKVLIAWDVVVRIWIIPREW